jgi:hypothetical protein
VARNRPPGISVARAPARNPELHARVARNVHHLTHDPVRVLIRSAFWLSGYELLFWAALFLVVLAPAERWLGTSRWLLAFASGHIERRC